MDLIMLAVIVVIAVLTGALIAACHYLEGRQHGR
jgi:hypothetical protein